MSENFAELFEESLKQVEMRPGAIISGKVVAIDSETVTVNAGLKSEGVIPRSQFQDTNGDLEVNVGDSVEVALDSIEDGFGETRLSRERAKRFESWRVLEKAHESSEKVFGVITGKVKGGFTVDVNKIRAFLPGSLVDVRPVRDTSHLEGKELEFKVIKLDQKRNNVVVSRRSVIEEETSAERDDLLTKLQEGTETTGIIKNLTDYGAFVDLGGVDGLLHITDMSWKRVKHPSEIVQVGDEVKVKVLKFDKDKNRVSLGMKQLGDDPWVDIANRYPESAKIFGRVTNLTDYGCFVEIEEGVEGLVHVSEMDWTNKNIHPSKVVNLGDEIEVMVLDIDEERRRISLGIKQCNPNPWNEFASKFDKNDKVSGKIKSITDFGIFIGLDGGIDGLVHLSDISWSLPGEEALRDYKKGDEVEAVVLAVDAERERISLGIKQIDEDPFSNYLSSNPKNSIVSGKVIEVDAKGVKVQLSDNVEGYIRTADLSSERVDDATKVVSVDDDIEAKFIGVDRKNRIISLSVKAKDMADEEEAVKNFGDGKGEESSAPTTLGDLLKAEMNKEDA